jgi:hypothetical protein
LDSLVRIEPYQWVTSDFLRKFFHARFLVIRAGCGAPVGRLAPPSTPPALFDAAILSELRSGIFSFNLSLIVRQSQPRHHEVAARFWQEIVGNSDPRICGDGERRPDAVTAIELASLALSDQRRDEC